MPGITSLTPAYRVPWLVGRPRERCLVLTNGGDERVQRVSTQMFGDGWMEPAVPRNSLEPRESLRVVLFGADVLDSGRISVHWSRPSGEEYVWTVAL